MSGHKKRSVGIKELKDRASEIVSAVERTGLSVSITRNNREVAKIMPIPSRPHERLVAAGVFGPRPKTPAPAGGELGTPEGDASPPVCGLLSPPGDRGPAFTLFPPSLLPFPSVVRLGCQ